MMKMANPNSILLNLDRELGEAIRTLIGQTAFGESTILVMEFMTNHKQELIDLWNNQGKDGQAIYDKWFKKWSMTKAEQVEAKERKEQEAFEKLKKSYLALNCPEDKAIDLATQFPDKDPFVVMGVLGYATQNSIGKERLDQQEQKQQEDKKEKLRNELAEINQAITEKEEYLKKTQIVDFKQKAEADLQSLKERREKLLSELSELG
jgi:hypothetical protein